MVQESEEMKHIERTIKRKRRRKGKEKGYREKRHKKNNVFRNKLGN